MTNQPAADGPEQQRTEREPGAAASAPVDDESADRPADHPTEELTPAGHESASDHPADDTPTGHESASDHPADDTPTGQESASDHPADDAPAGDAPAKDILAGDAPADDILAGDAPAGDTTAHLPPEPGADLPPGGFPPGGMPPGGMPPGGFPPPWTGFPPPGPGPGFPPPGGFPPPPPGTGGWATRYGLVRPAQGRVFAGVGAAIGRATNTDPVLWRVLFAVLTLAGGIGLLAYVIGWLLIPGEGDTASPLEALLGRGRSSTSPILVIIIGVITAIALSSVIYHGLRSALLLIAIIAGAIVLITRGGPTFNNRQPPHTPPGGIPPGGMPSGWVPPAPATGPVPTPPMATVPMGADPTATMPPGAGPTGAGPTGAGPTGAGPTGAGPTGAGPMPPPPPYRPPFAPYGPYASTSPYPGLVPPPPPVARPARPPSRLGRFTFSLLLIVLGALAVIDILAGVHIPFSGFLAAALATAGLGLVIGAWFGRARSLIALGIVLTVMLGIATAADNWRRARVDGGDVMWQPTSVSDLSNQYEQNFGSATLDLRKVDFTNHDEQVNVRVNAGDLNVLLPPNVDVEADTKVNVGDAIVFGNHWGGVGAPSRDITDNGADGPGGGHLFLKILVNAGNVGVHR